MKIGYPCINTAINCTANSTFRLANLSEQNLIDRITGNLNCLEKILFYNTEKKLLFFRIGSGLIPFAGHKNFRFDWPARFGEKIKKIGDYVKRNEIRISMHPDQFVLINSPDRKLVQNSLSEIEWHCRLLDLMGLDRTAKVQIHIGGAYGDKISALDRFSFNYLQLPRSIKERLVVENDERIYSLKDCLDLSAKIGLPVLFDSFHHDCLNNGEEMLEALKKAGKTWKKEDGVPMTDYSSQEPGGRRGKHAQKIDLDHFRSYLDSVRGIDFDIMLEIKDKEESALKALRVI